MLEIHLLGKPLSTKFQIIEKKKLWVFLNPPKLIPTVTNINDGTVVGSAFGQ